MKKLLAVTLIGCTLALTGCGNTMWVDGKKYGTYGLFNQDSMKNDKVEYRIVVGNVVWAIILVETIIFPIYFVGFSLYEPVGLKGQVEKGVIK